MIRWTRSDAYGLRSDAYGFGLGLLEAGRVEMQAEALREQSRRAAVASRKRDEQARRRMATLCWGLVSVVVVVAASLLAPLLDSPRDHVGADELAHVRAGHSVAEVRL